MSPSFLLLFRKKVVGVLDGMVWQLQSLSGFAVQDFYQP